MIIREYSKLMMITSHREAICLDANLESTFTSYFYLRTSNVSLKPVFFFISISPNGVSSLLRDPDLTARMKPVFFTNRLNWILSIQGYNILFFLIRQRMTKPLINRWMSVFIYIMMRVAGKIVMYISCIGSIRKVIRMIRINSRFDYRYY